MKLSTIFVVFLFLLAVASCKTQYKKEYAPDEGFKIIIGPEEGENATAEAEKNETKQEEAKPAATFGKKLEETKCNESATLGYLSCSYTTDRNLLLKLKNTGKTDLEGVWYYFYDAELNALGEDSEMFEFRLGSEKELSVKSSQFSSLKRVEIHPVQSNKICGNKQLVLMPENSCR